MTKTTATSPPHGTRTMLARFLSGCLYLFFFSIFFAGCKALFDLVIPQIIRYTIDTVLGGKPSALPAWADDLVASLGGPAALRENLLIPAAAVLFVGVAALLCQYADRVFCARGAEKLVYRMRNQLFGKLMSLPAAFFAAHHTGDLIQRCTSDTETVKRFLSEQLTALLRVLLLLSLSLFFMFSMNVTLSLIAVTLLPLIVAYSAYFGRRVRQGFRVCDENEGALSAIVQENLTGVRVVRAFGREAYERGRFAAGNETYTNAWVRVCRHLSAFWSVGDILSGTQVLLILAFGARACVAGELTAGSFVAFLSYNAMLIWPVRQLGRIISEMSKAGVSLSRIAEIMDSPSEADAPDAAAPDTLGDIVFEHVTFSYDDGAPLLSDVSFTIPAGTTLGVLGGTGSGKSTLVSLLLRLYELPEGCGRITVGGRDIRHIPRAWLRTHIAAVLQEPFLFSRTLGENLTITRPGATAEEREGAARDACLSETVAAMTAGYDTVVGERGVTLSGGQKQRAAIARLLIGDPDAMIFDDSLSAVDTETDEKIRAALARRTKGASVLLISHRVSTLMAADRILLLERGRVAEYGSPADLLARPGGLFRRVYDIQAGNADATDGEKTPAPAPADGKEVRA